MKLTKAQLFAVKLLVSSVIIVYLLFTFRHALFSSSRCSYLYKASSFLTCASSNKSCNVSILLNSYLAYCTCVIQHSSTSADYVVFDAVNGLGNRVLGLIAVTVYALVHRRVLLINWQPGDNHQAHFEDLFLPVPSSLGISLVHQYSPSRLASLIKNRWMNEIEGNVNSSRIPRDWAFYYDRDLLCDGKSNSQRWFQRIGINVLNLINRHVKWIRTDQYFTPLFKRNQKTKLSFTTLFENGQVFAELAPKLLRPVAKVNSIVNSFQTRYNLSDVNVTIGVHMRSWSANMVDHIEPFQKCLEYVIQNITRSDKERIKIRLYIISNTPKRRQQLEHQILQTHTNFDILHPPEPPQNASAIEQMQYTLAELLILSQMQHLLTTAKSTFGMVAQGLARKGAWVVRQGAANQRGDISSDLCEWESSSEPEYQMMGSLETDDDCVRRGGSLPSIGERTVL